MISYWIIDFLCDYDTHQSFMRKDNYNHLNILK